MPKEEDMMIDLGDFDPREHGLPALDDIEDAALEMEKERSVVPIEYIAALRYTKSLSCNRIGMMIGTSGENVRKRLKRAGFTNSMVATYRDMKADMMELKQFKIFMDLDDAAIEKMKPFEKVRALTMLEEKIRLIRGEATEIVKKEDIDMSLEELEEQERILKAEAGIVDITPMEVEDASFSEEKTGEERVYSEDTGWGEGEGNDEEEG